MFDALADGTLKAVWIVCTNPAQSMPNQALVRKALARAEFVVLQEAYANTATAPFADVLLPAASWGEKDGTVTNSERRISRVRAARAPYGEARPTGRSPSTSRGGSKRSFARACRACSLFNDRGHLERNRATTLGRDLDIGGLSYALLETQGPQQWPYPAERQERLSDFIWTTGSRRPTVVPASRTSATNPWPKRSTCGTRSR
ncbi:MAG: molybdopterin-dependent oxidoreductase [Pararobbsia sp.]